MSRKKMPADPQMSNGASENADNQIGPSPAEEATTEIEPLDIPVAPDYSFPIVGIGASAGGLAAFEAFFSAMPADTESGMALVLVQHLAPDHKSILSDLIRRYTQMEVFQVEDGMRVQPNCVYIIPPNRDMALLDGALHLFEPNAPRGRRLSIDFFFRSLAQDQHERAICIVLSGTGSDGSLGSSAVKGEGGMVMAQDPEGADFDGMPRSAIATGLVDYVLPPAEMPAQLIAYVQHIFAAGTRPVAAPSPKAGSLLKKVCVVLRAQTGHDFSQYKENTLMRCIERRMALQQINQSDDYLRFIQQTPAEAEALFRDLLIGVTAFFRDTEAFAALEADAIPRLFAGKQPGDAVRVWVCACSTGEEAYSIAILIQEYLDAHKQPFHVQIFATDVDRFAIEQARAGLFSPSIAADISPERLAHYFTQETADGVYRIQKVIRDLLIFSEQDVIADPPFSKLDLVSCRNLLIYLNSDLQKKIIALFHYALLPTGTLFLGSSESVGENENTALFGPLDRKAKIYERQQEFVTHPVIPSYVANLPDSGIHAPDTPTGDVGKWRDNLRDWTEQTLLAHYAEAGVLVNGRGEIFYIYGHTGSYLEPAPGAATPNILSMARDGLRRELTTALQRAVTRKEAVHLPGLRVRTNGSSITANLTVCPVTGGPVGASAPELFVVILQESRTETAPALSAGPVGATEEDISALTDKRVAALEAELHTKEEYLQTMLEDIKAANEELNSTNEEMQSMNEELATVNTELQTKVTDLSRINNDMNNLLAGTGVGTLFVDERLQIARFTPATTQLINLIQSDVGRPVGHIVSNLVGYDRLVEDVQSVLDSLIPVEVEVQTRAGAWYLMRIRPYRTLANEIEGAVIIFMDISTLKNTQMALTAAQAFADSIVATVRDPLLVLDEKLRVVAASRSFYSVFRVDERATIGETIYELGNSQWNIPDLRRLLEEILPKNNSFDDYLVEHTFETIGLHRMLLNARRIDSIGDQAALILLAMEDVTE